ncbi:MAG: DUF2520 domain-containing protein [Firmicutes bacterium]|nr:DUF2520 domain-containing protein [Bacillota bacterium]
MRIGFIGAGKVGFSLGKYMTERNICVSGYYSRSASSAREASEFTNTKFFDDLGEIVSESDALFLTVPDRTIKDVWDSLKQFSLKDKSVCHCSGAMSSSVFTGIEEAGAFGYSIHPLFAVCDKLHSYQNLSKAYFTIEFSDEKAKENALYFKSMFESMGNQVRFITKEQKVLYHCAAVLSSNLVTGLFSCASDILKDCGFDERASEEALMPLFLNNCENIGRIGVVNSLTGPVERADTGTVREHLQALPGSRENVKTVYKELSKKLIEISGKKNPGRDYSELREALR